MGSQQQRGAGSRRWGRLVKSWRRAPEILECARQIAEWRSVVLAYLGLRAAHYPFTIHFRSGDRVEVETYHDLVTLWVVFFRQEYRVGEQFATIIDAGANIGTFALYAARKAPHAVIHALEPFPSTRERLLKTLRDNGLEARVRVHPAGLAGSESRRFMAATGPSQSRGISDEPGAEKVEVRTMTLEQFLDVAGIPERALLKMDIEGAEHEVFEAASGATLRRFSEIALEYHPNGSRQALFHKLEANGFVCAQDRRDHENSGVAQFVLRAP